MTEICTTLQNPFPFIHYSSRIKSPHKELRDYSNRLKTYDNWPVVFINPEELARAGFFYLKIRDTVQCPYCGVQVGKWEPNDVPIDEHAHWSPNCEFVKTEKNNKSLIEVDGAGPKPTLTYEYPKFLTKRMRLETYKNFPKIKQKPEDLADAGFFYSGKGDEVVCFSCGQGIYKWEECDIPWQEHLVQAPDCAYVVEQKYKDRIPENNSCVNTKESQVAINELTTEKGEELADDVACRICYNEKKSILFLPCRHLATCVSCSQILQECPICKSVVKECLKVNL